MPLDENIWLPKYLFVLTTIGCEYPKKTNETTRKKYYEFIQNLPLFMPDGDISKLMEKLLNDYPVTPYLEDREAFIKWVHFIKNKLNVYLGIEEKTTTEDMKEYYDQYKPKHIIMNDIYQKKSRYLIMGFIFITILSGYYFYKKF